MFAKLQEKRSQAAARTTKLCEKVARNILDRAKTKAADLNSGSEFQIEHTLAPHNFQVAVCLRVAAMAPDYGLCYQSTSHHVHAFHKI